MKKKIILLSLVLICLTTTTWAADLQPYIHNYLQKRYFSNPHVSIDFEQITGFIEKKDSAGTLIGLFIMQKNGSSYSLDMGGTGHLTAISQAYLYPAFLAFKEARQNLLETASGDLSSGVKLEKVLK